MVNKEDYDSYDGYVDALVERITTLQAENAALRADNQKLRTVMIAAAEEISRFWSSHCDEEGYGPINLLHRLEAGIPSEYGYTAGAFAKLTSELAMTRELLSNAIDADWAKEQG